MYSELEYKAYPYYYHKVQMVTLRFIRNILFNIIKKCWNSKKKIIINIFLMIIYVYLLVKINARQSENVNNTYGRVIWS